MTEPLCDLETQKQPFLQLPVLQIQKRHKHGFNATQRQNKMQSILLTRLMNLIIKHHLANRELAYALTLITQRQAAATWLFEAKKDIK